MTVRSVLIGLFGAAFICGVTFLNDRVLQGTYLIGNNMPVVVYGTLILFAVGINPLLKRFALSGREIAVAMALTLAACCLPTSGLLRTFTDILIMPRHFEKTQPGWSGGAAAIADSDVKDWALFTEALKSSASAEGPRKKLYLRLPAELRERISSQDGFPSPELRADLREALNAVARDRSWPDADDLAVIEFSEDMQRLASSDESDLTEGEVERLGRAALEAVFEGHITPRKKGILEEIPPHLLVEVGEDDEEKVVGGFVQGMGKGLDHVSVNDVPWHAWTGTLAFWLPFIIVLLAAIVCLSVIVHKQWSQHELLPYPIAIFTDTLLPKVGDPASSRASALTNRLFWIGAGVVLAIHLTNYAFQWAPKHLFSIPVSFDFSSLSELFPTVTRGGGYFLFSPHIFFIVVGMAYFVANDVSLSFSVGAVLWSLVVGTFAGYGFNIEASVEGTGWWMSVTPRLFVIFGSCLGIFMVLAYTGRRYYRSVALAAFGRPSGDDIGPAEIWAFRAFVFLFALFVVLLSWGADVGLPFALLYTIIAVIGFVVTSRVIAETGLFHIQIMIFPCIILWGLFGARMIGVQVLLVMQLVSVILFIDPRESLMPFMVNSLKLLERRGEKLGKPAIWAVVALVLGLAVGLPVTLYIQYDQGLTGDYWAEHMVPKMPLENAVSLRSKYEAQGLAASSKGEAEAETTGFRPNATCVYALLAGFALVILFTVARLRLNWWPLHPLMFALWATNHVKHFAVSFFVGWAVKMLIVKYGGNYSYDRLKPLMVGLIAGEVLGAFVPCIFGFFYWLVMGEPPMAFRVLPG